jgi:hypothetical protein
MLPVVACAAAEEPLANTAMRTRNSWAAVLRMRTVVSVFTSYSIAGQVLQVHQFAAIDACGRSVQLFGFCRFRNWIYVQIAPNVPWNCQQFGIFEIWGHGIFLVKTYAGR